MPKVLVTGGCGYIGSHVTRQLSEAGYAVTVIDNLSTGFRDSLLHGEELVVADLRDEKAVDALFARGRFEAVLHFAASIVVPDSVADPLRYYDNNTGGTLQLLGACRRHKVDRFVFSSTAAVYGESPKPVAESAPLSPANPYGRSKLVDEWILSDLAATSPFRYVALRYFNVAGADLQCRIGHRTENATHLLRVACEAAVGRRKEVVVFGEDYPTPDGTGVRDYIHVEDLAAAHLIALRHLEGRGESLVLNCGYGHGFSVRQVLAEVRRQAGDFRVVAGKRRAGDPACVVADASLIRTRLGWKPKYDDLAQIVSHALAYERKRAGKPPGDKPL